MKAKNLGKKLVLTRETVANLNETQMKLALGGIYPPSFTTGCPKYCYDKDTKTSCNPCACE